MKADFSNTAIVLLVFMNALAGVQFQALARTTPLGVSKVSTLEITGRQLWAALRYLRPEGP
jgi:hypothetical protein